MMFAFESGCVNELFTAFFFQTLVHDRYIALVFIAYLSPLAFLTSTSVTDYLYCLAYLNGIFVLFVV